MRKITLSIAVILFSVFLGYHSNAQNNKISVSDKKFDIPDDAVNIIYKSHIYIPSEADSIVGNFVFDTGADGLYLDSLFYANNSFKKHNYFNALLPGAGTSGAQKVKLIQEPITFSFKNYLNSFYYVPIFSLKPILGDFADGVIGKNSFSINIMEIDYYHEYLRFHKDFSEIDLSSFTKIPMKVNNNRVFLPVTIYINDSISIDADFLLDLGFGGTVTIATLTSKNFNLSNNIINKELFYDKYGGVSGESFSWVFRSDSVKIGNYTLNNVIMDYSEDKSGALGSGKYAGLLGNNILDRFHVFIDFLNNDLYLKPNPNNDKAYNFSKLGFRYTDRSLTKKSWIVTGLYKNSNAENAGLQIDDEIISVNGIDIQRIPFLQQDDFFKEIDKLSLVIIRKAVKMEINFNLEDQDKI